jgi:hypothetical protein
MTTGDCGDPGGGEEFVDRGRREIKRQRRLSGDKHD